MSILRIISANRKTFYEFDTGNRVSQLPRIIFYLVAASISSTIVYGELKDLLAGILNVLAILCGFSFTTLFFIINEKGNDKHPETDILEDVFIGKKLDKLTREIFCNVSYFIVVSSAAIILTILNLTQSATVGVGQFMKIYSFFAGAQDLASSAPQSKDALFSATDIAVSIASWSGRTILFMLLFECIYTFTRIVMRLNFLFSKKFGG